jgi:hypothetical protein
MKYLLMLLLFAGICQGQDKEYQEFVKKWQDKVAKQRYVKLLDQYQGVLNEYCRIELHDTTRFTDRPITRQDLIDYFQECYNDSTTKEIHLRSVNGFCEGRNGVCSRESHHKMVVIHKDPTFTGFKEWLEKR